jgi:Zn-dependent M28 family amino/carboxypeptidase
VAAALRPSGYRDGTVGVTGNRATPSDAVPTIVVAGEQYNLLGRLAAQGRPPTLRVELRTRYFEEDRNSYNVIAEIPGQDPALRNQIVLVGAHLDSWHTASGATDNADGAAAVMEAMRIIRALGVTPRRTIRVALWSGEEQGLLGSRAYVRQHFGTFEDQKPEYAKLSAYINMDSGTGRVRGLTAFGPAATGNVLRETTASFKDLGMLGATTTRSRGAGGTDSTNFNAAGLPGINTMLDPIQYQTYTWHTNLDTYERIVEDDVKKAAIVIAGTVYHLAMRDELLPRFSREEMPRGPGAPPPPPSTPPSTSGAPPATAPSN